MAQRSGRTLSQMVIERRVKKVTSIGHSSSRTRPTNKHKRIIDTLEPLLTQHRLVVDSKVIKSDYEDTIQFIALREL